MTTILQSRFKLWLFPGLATFNTKPCRELLDNYWYTLLHNTEGICIQRVSCLEQVCEVVKSFFFGKSGFLRRQHYSGGQSRGNAGCQAERNAGGQAKGNAWGQAEGNDKCPQSFTPPKSVCKSEWNQNQLAKSIKSNHEEFCTITFCSNIYFFRNHYNWQPNK